MTTLRHAGAVLFAVLVLAVSAPATSAHAALETSDPLDGGTIASPYVLVFRFDEELKSDGSSVTVRDSSGAIVVEGGLSADDAFTQVVELPAVPPGAYQAHWVSITADDNGKTQGDVNFTVVAATPSPAVTPTPATSPTYAPPSESATATPAATPALTATPLPTRIRCPGRHGPTGRLGAHSANRSCRCHRGWPGLVPAPPALELSGPLDHLPDPAGILFDLDGTLVDTVEKRIEGWLTTFTEIGIEADRDHVARLIGADGKRLAIEVAGVAGRELSPERAEAIDRRAGEAFSALNTDPQPLPGARHLLQALGRSRLPWAIATSSLPEQVSNSVKALDLEKPPIIVDGSHVEHAKPAPDLLLHGAEKLR